jgi:hypothetical protein
MPFCASAHAQTELTEQIVANILLTAVGTWQQECLEYEHISPRPPVRGRVLVCVCVGLPPQRTRMNA